MDSNNAENKSYIASQVAEKVRFDLLCEGQSFCFETIFSHESKIEFIKQAKELDYPLKQNRHQQVIIVNNGDYKLKTDQLPDWAKGFLQEK